MSQIRQNAEAIEALEERVAHLEDELLEGCLRADGGGGEQYRKSGAVENAADAFGLSEWFAGALAEAHKDRFGGPIHAEVRIDVRPVRLDAPQDRGDGS